MECSVRIAPVHAPYAAVEEFMKSLCKSIIAAALQYEAKLVLRKYKPHIIAVTGSVGKTSAKDAIYTALAPVAHVRKSEKSFNSEIGIPLTIIGQPNAWFNPLGWLQNLIEGAMLIVLRSRYPEWLVLEVGADRPGDIQKVAGWLSPDIVVVTRLPDVPVHVEFFESPEALIDEKSYLPRALRSGGTLIVNADDERALRFRSTAPHARTITYGFAEGADIRATNEHIVYEDGIPDAMSCKVEHEGSSVPMTLHCIVGRQGLYAALAALAVGVARGHNLVELINFLRTHEPAPGRMRVLRGICSSVLIDDTYNSSPAATHEALSVLCGIDARGKKIAVLGDMMELGTYSADAHRAAGTKAAECADVLVTVGLRSRYAAEGARKVGMKKRDIFSFDEATQAAEKLRELVGEGDVVLLKASQSVRLERATATLLADPDAAQSVLVRQDAAWQRR